MTKRVEHTIKYYHYSEADALTSLRELLDTLEGLLPECEVSFESCKSDFDVLKIVYEEEWNE
jgi:hypothetical protein